MEVIMILYNSNIEDLIPMTLDILYSEGKVDSKFILGIQRNDINIFDFEEWILNFGYHIIISKGNILLCKEK